MKTTSGILIVLVGLFVFVSCAMGLVGFQYLSEINSTTLWLVGIFSFIAVPYGLAVLYEDTFSVDFDDYITYFGILCLSVLILIAIIAFAVGIAAVLFL